jgi:hypothetical protein
VCCVISHIEDFTRDKVRSNEHCLVQHYVCGITVYLSKQLAEVDALNALYAITCEPDQMGIYGQPKAVSCFTVASASC